MTAQWSASKKKSFSKPFWNSLKVPKEVIKQNTLRFYSAKISILFKIFTEHDSFLEFITKHNQIWQRDVSSRPELTAGYQIDDTPELSAKLDDPFGFLNQDGLP